MAIELLSLQNKRLQPLEKQKENYLGKNAIHIQNSRLVVDM
jgi:hypothetical protein